MPQLLLSTIQRESEIRPSECLSVCRPVRPYVRGAAISHSMGELGRPSSFLSLSHTHALLPVVVVLPRLRHGQQQTASVWRLLNERAPLPRTRAHVLRSSASQRGEILLLQTFSSLQYCCCGSQFFLSFFLSFLFLGGLGDFLLFLVFFLFFFSFFLFFFLFFFAFSLFVCFFTPTHPLYGDSLAVSFGWGPTLMLSLWDGTTHSRTHALTRGASKQASTQRHTDKSTTREERTMPSKFNTFPSAIHLVKLLLDCP